MLAGLFNFIPKRSLQPSAVEINIFPLPCRGASRRIGAGQQCPASGKTEYLQPGHRRQGCQSKRMFRIGEPDSAGLVLHLHFRFGKSNGGAIEVKTPKEFDYDLWIAEDGQYMVRVKATHEVCAVNQEVFRKLRAEEKKLRREMAGVPTRNVDEKGRTIKATMLSTDFVNVRGSEDMDPTWLIDPHDFEKELLLQESICELREQLTERQLEVFEVCVLGGMSLRDFAQRKGISHTAVNFTYAAIRKKFEKIFGDTFPNAN